jgi:hypothetical protein
MSGCSPITVTAALPQTIFRFADSTLPLPPSPNPASLKTVFRLPRYGSEEVKIGISRAEEPILLAL